MTGAHVVSFYADRIAINGEPVFLAAQQRSLLALLACRTGVAIRTRTLVRYALCCLPASSENQLPLYMSNMKKRMAHATRGDDLIHVIWQYGYRFGDPA
jgi:DNA-binding response OmpR family regulator